MPLKKSGYNTGNSGLGKNVPSVEPRYQTKPKPSEAAGFTTLSDGRMVNNQTGIVTNSGEDNMAKSNKMGGSKRNGGSQRSTAGSRTSSSTKRPGRSAGTSRYQRRGR